MNNEARNENLRSAEADGWYSGPSESIGWYSGSPGSPAPAPAQTPKKAPRKKHTGMKAVMITLSVLVLLVATALVFSEPEDRLSAPAPTSEPQPGEIDPGFNAIPDWDSGDSDDSEDGFFDDYRDFFDNYFTSDEETSAPSSLPTVSGNPGVKLVLNSSHGMEELSLQELYSSCVDSIVGIRAQQGDSLGYSWGTGIVMDSRGYILTNQHVIGGSDRAVVVLSDGSELEALLVGEDIQTDVAVLYVEPDFPLREASFGDSGELIVGDRVAAIGNPLGEDLSGTMTDGIISAINRDMSYDGHSVTLLQTNAAINEGNSGGPLINMYGQVIGITNMKMVNYYSDVTIEGIGFAIPSSTIKTVADQLIENGSFTGRPGIGITVGAIPDEAAEYYDLPEGLYISAVSPGSDAEAKGIIPGDILTHVDGQQVLVSDDVLSIRDSHQVGDKLTFTIYRDGETFDVEVELYDVNDIY